MATLFDLAQQYLNRALPETFRYDRTNQPGIPTPVPTPVVPEPIKQLPRPGGNAEGFSVYNPDPNRTRTPDRYSPYNYRQAAERNLIGDFYSSGTEAQKLMDMYPDYYTGPQLTGIPGAIQGYMKNSIPGQLIGNVMGGIENLLPVNRRAILENEALGAGIRLDDIGRVVSDGGNINTAENIMAGYNLNKVTPETIQKRRDVINKNMKDPEQKKAKLDALNEFEEKMFGETGIKTKADLVFDDKSLAKDPTYKSTQELIDIGIQAANDDSENDMYDGGSILDTITPTGISTTTFPGMGTITPMGPTYGGLDSIGSGGGITFAPTAPITSGSVLADKKINTIKDYIDIGGGGGQDNDGPITTPDYSNVTTAKGPPGQISKPSYGTGSGGLGDYQIQPSKPATKKDYGPYSGGGGGGGGQDSCFLPNTLVTMIDGSTKKIIDVDIGDEVAEGGKVFATGKFLNNELYDYKGVKVSGSHMVNEDGIWMRVRDTKYGKPLGDEEHTVYVFGSENRRILINNILFTDYFEVNEQDKLMNNEEDFFDNWKLYAKQDSGNNVDIINAS